MNIIKCNKYHNGIEEINKQQFDYCRKCNGLGYINTNNYERNETINHKSDIR